MTVSKPAEADAHRVRKAVYCVQSLTSIQVPTRSNSSTATYSASGDQLTSTESDWTADATIARRAAS